MIDLTPLDVRKKRGDFKKSLRGYDPLEVDGFLELVAERMEELVKANMTLEERAQRLGEQVVSLGGRERAVNEALVTAQQLRDEIRDQAQREAEQIRRDADREVSQLRKEAERETSQMRKEAEHDASQMRKEAEHEAEHLRKETELETKSLVSAAEAELKERSKALTDMESQRTRFLDAYRQLLNRQLELVEVEETRSPLEDVAVELDLGGGRGSYQAPDAEPAPADVDMAAAESDASTDEAEGGEFDAGWEDGGDPDHGDRDAEHEVSGDEGSAADEPVAADTDVAVEFDDDDAIPVEGLAPSGDDFVDNDVTLLPASGASGSSLVGEASLSGGAEGTDEDRHGGAHGG
ncbi:MAG: DivIVA domain-containing protein [Gemmatimonadetes bacterium]|nr:DivIVA domain-containing protein [Gemmatimonadota bacterium]